MDRCAARTGHLVVFDRRANRSWDEKIFRKDVDQGGPADYRMGDVKMSSRTPA